MPNLGNILENLNNPGTNTVTPDMTAPTQQYTASEEFANFINEQLTNAAMMGIDPGFQAINPGDDLLEYFNSGAGGAIGTGATADLAVRAGIPLDVYNYETNRVSNLGAANRSGHGVLGSALRAFGEHPLAGSLAAAFGGAAASGAFGGAAGASGTAAASDGLAPITVSATPLAGASVPAIDAAAAAGLAGTAPLAAMPAGLGAAGAAIPAATGALPAASGTLTNAALPAAGAGLLPTGGAPNVPGATPPINPTSPAGSGGKWWEQILRGLGGGEGAGIGNNIFAGLTGLAGLSALFGGNDLSDMFGLTGANASAFRGVNTAGPGGSSTSFNPDTNTLTASGGVTDALPGQLASFAGSQITQAGQNNQGNILALLREQAKPEEQKAFNQINQNLFSRGRLGAQDSATGEAYEGFARGQSQADLARQLASYGLSDQLQTSAYNRGSGAANTASTLQNNVFLPAILQQNTTQGQASPMLEFLNQFLRKSYGG